MVQSKNNLTFREATDDDVDSLATIIPRSYAPDAFLNKLFPPESEVIRDWWANVYRKAISSPMCHILVAIDGKLAVGVLTLQLWKSNPPGQPYGGICTLVPLTEDHGEIFANALQSQAEHRRELMPEQTNFMIDLMAVDTGYQSTGIGKRLVKRACELADEQNAVVFLQTTKARKYYLNLRLGFESEKGDVSGDVVRPAKQSI